MSERCLECRAPLAEGGSCRDLFHALLLLESRIPGGPGAFAHFYAVATYGLQHPRGMNYTVEAWTGLRQAVSDALDGRANIEQLRRRARHHAARAGRVTRREGEPELLLSVERWPMTIADVINVEPVADAYEQRVVEWARSVRETLASMAAEG